MSLVKPVHLALHMFTTRYSGSSTTVVQDDDCDAGLNRDQGDMPSGRARLAKHSWTAGSAARVQEDQHIACIPVSRACGDRLGSSTAVARRL